MGKMLKVVIGNKASMVSENYVMSMLKVAMDAMVERNVNAIVAVTKDDYFEFKKDTFDSYVEMITEVNRYRELGFKVEYVSKAPDSEK